MYYVMPNNISSNTSTSTSAEGGREQSVILGGYNLREGKEAPSGVGVLAEDASLGASRRNVPLPPASSCSL